MNRNHYWKIAFFFILAFKVLSHRDGWCADKEKVVFVNEKQLADGSYSIYGYYDIFIVNYDGTGLKKLAENGINPVPSPDGKKVAYIPIRIEDDQLGLSIINTDGTGRKSLIKKEKEQDRLRFCCLRWSPDSRKIAYLANNTEIGKKGASLWIIDIVTGERKEIYADIEDISIINWSPDGKEILLMMPGLQSGIKPSRPMYAIISMETLKKTRLDLEKISIAPIAVLILDKKRLLYYKDEDLWVVNRDGSNNEKLVHVGKILELLIPKYAFEIVRNKHIRISIIESGSKGNAYRLYEYDLHDRSLNMTARTDDANFEGYFSYSGSKILLDTEKEHDLPNTLAVKDLKTGKTYVLCDSWRTFKQEVFMVYENVNWVLNSK
jgi:Tol biopolymer transport system component